jgi:hypothetical protein
MSDSNVPKQTLVDDETRARRQFLKKIGKNSVAVPAAALLLAASAKEAQAGSPSGACGACGGCGCGCVGSE